jgi:integrase
MQAITLALPMSSAATRSASSLSSSVSSTAGPPSCDQGARERLPAGVTGGQETDSRARSDNAWPLKDSRRQTVRRPGHILATRSLKDTHAILRRAIQHAQRRNKVLRNVAELVDVPEGRPGRPSKAMPLAQAQAVVEASKKTRLHAYFVLSLLTGVRTEEASALTWDRVHLESEGDLPPHVEVW